MCAACSAAATVLVPINQSSENSHLSVFLASESYFGKQLTPILVPALNAHKTISETTCTTQPNHEAAGML